MDSERDRGEMRHARRHCGGLRGDRATRRTKEQSLARRSVMLLAMGTLMLTRWVAPPQASVRVKAENARLDDHERRTGFAGADGAFHRLERTARLDPSRVNPTWSSPCARSIFLNASVETRHASRQSSCSYPRADTECASSPGTIRKSSAWPSHRQRRAGDIR